LLVADTVTFHSFLPLRQLPLQWVSGSKVVGAWSWPITST